MDTVKRIASYPGAGIFGILVLTTAFFWLCNPVFLSPANIAVMLRVMAYYGIVSVGMALCLISGMIDLSVGGTAGLASVIFAKGMYTWGMAFVPAILLGLLTGVVVGMVNSFIILKLKVTPFIATISMMFVLRGLANWVSNGYSIYPLPEGPSTLGNATPLGVSWAFIAFLVILAVAAYVLSRTVFGLCMRATGSDREVARWTEVPVNTVNTVTFVTVATLAALSGIFLSCMLNSGVPTAGTGWELTAITACAIGGVSLFGYEGSMFGLFCGLALLQVLQNGILMIGVSPYLQVVVVGIVLLISMILDVRRRAYLNLEKL